MSDARHFKKYDLALREWDQECLVSDQSDSDYLYYSYSLNEYRLGKYLLTIDQLTGYTIGHILVDMPRLRETGAAKGIVDREDYLDCSLGEIIGVRTEELLGNVWRPGHWIVLNLGEVEIVPGSVSTKPIMVGSHDVGD